ncbi:uncharacterized protein LOC130138125 isoform X3 [Syzygium oleosum]|uniref:uncharacterized protein LOC130138125 isoform X3 n=1 Tax=Syzygium oleosum TaxID=219896 RepID=UPI0024BBD046|nr:uncharacterized protein LOC130138125 isoform X3 [Syzygium oleosum]
MIGHTRGRISSSDALNKSRGCLSLPLYGLIISAVAVATTLCNFSSSFLFRSAPQNPPLPPPSFVSLRNLCRALNSASVIRFPPPTLLGGLFSWPPSPRFLARQRRARTSRKNLCTLAMESSGVSSFLRNRKLESILNASSIETFGVSAKPLVKEGVGYQPRTDGYVDDDGWFSELISWIRIVTCFLSMMVTTFIWALIMVILIPWPYERIRQGNIYGHVTGRLLMWILGNPIKFEGLEYADEKAAYICNHASPIDIFLIMWLTPTGTVGIAKKEVKSLLLKSVICWLFMSGIRSIMLTAMQGAMIH